MELNPSLHDVDSCPSDKIELVVQVVRQVQIEGIEASISFHELSARVDSAEYKVQTSTNLKMFHYLRFDVKNTIKMASCKQKSLLKTRKPPIARYSFETFK